MANQLLLTKNRLKKLMKYVKAHGEEKCKGLLISLDGKPSISPIFDNDFTLLTAGSAITSDGKESLCPYPPGCDDIPEPDESK